MKKLVAFMFIILLFSVYPLIAGAEQTAAPEVILFEDFSNGLPDTWDVVDGYLDGHTWTLSNSEIGPIMIANSEQAGQSITMDEQLITPSLDCSQAEYVHLEVSWIYRSRTRSDYVIIDVQADGGPWVTLETIKPDRSEMVYRNTSSLNVSSMAAGHADVRFRFYYHNANREYFIAIGDVLVEKVDLDYCKPDDSDPALGSRVIYEDWECELFDPNVWTFLGLPRSTIESELGYNSSYGLNPNGDDWCDSGLVSKKTFDLSRGLRLRWKMRNVYDEVYDFFQTISFGITTGEKIADGDCAGEEYVKMATATINAAKVWPSLSFNKSGYPSDILQESWGMPFPGNIWVEAEIIVHKDGKISFWLDGKLKMVTSEAIDFSQTEYKYDTSRVQIMGGSLWRECQNFPIIDDIAVYTDVDQESPSPSQEPMPDGSLPLMQKEIPGYAAHSMIPIYLESGSAASPYPYLADIDGDGDLDGFFAISGRLDFYKNNGTRFDPRLELETQGIISSSTGATIVNARLADMDSDGDLDLFLSLTDCKAGYQLPRIEIYRNNGDIHDHDFHLYKVITQLFDGDVDPIDVADVDGDGDLDILLGFAIVAEHLGIIENIGTPESPEWGAYRSWLSCPGTRRQQITHGDLDGDGQIELLVGLGDGRLMLYKQKSPFGINDWEQVVFSYLSQDVGEESAPCLVDLDTDGDMDMVVGSFSGHIRWFENQGSILKPYWASSDIILDLSNNLRSVAPACGDLDGDGDIDLLLGDLNGNLTACWNDGTADQPVWGRIDRSFGGIKVNARSAPALGDLDQDGDLDLLIGNACGTIVYYENVSKNGTPQWEIREEKLAGLDAGYVARPVLIDMDEDKDLDILVGGFDGYLAYIRNDGVANSPQFVQDGCNVLSVLPEAKQLMSAPAGGDIDDDGDIDLLFGEKDGGITFFRNMSPKLSISPNIITMLQETSQQFKIRGLSGLDALDCSIIRNQSAGVLTVVDDTTVSYMAGPTGGTNVVDVIEIKDSLKGLYMTLLIYSDFKNQDTRHCG